MKKLFACLFSLLFFCATIYGQGQKPIVTVSNIDWGWFSLQLNTFSVVPKTTQWVIREKSSGKIVLDTKCDQKTDAPCLQWCKNDFYGDSRDVRDKLIQGCKPDHKYWVKARHTNTNGTAWMQWSDSVEVQTPPMPILDGEEVVVNIFGDFFVRYGDQCNIISTIRLGDEETNVEDNFCHAVQNEIRRLSGKNIRIVNQGTINGKLTEWRATHGPRFSAEFADKKKFPLAVFCYGVNDAKSGTTQSQFATEIDTIAGYLAALQVKSLFNSIYYVSDTNYITADLNLKYRNSWSAKMNEISTSGTEKSKWVVRGVDFHQLFKLNETRHLGPDGVHIDLTEGVSNIASKLAPAILDIIFPNMTNTIHTNQKSSLQIWTTQQECMLNNENLPAGNYQLQIQTLSGVTVHKQNLTIYQAGGITRIPFASKLNPGLYVVRLAGENPVTLYSAKMMILQ